MKRRKRLAKLSQWLVLFLLSNTVLSCYVQRTPEAVFVKKIASADKAFEEEKYAESERLYREALELNTVLLNDSNAKFLILDRLATSCSEQGKLEEAAAVLRAKLDFIETSFKNDAQLKSGVNEQLALLYANHSDCSKAITYFRKALEQKGQLQTLPEQLREDRETYRSLLSLKGCLGPTDL